MKRATTIGSILTLALAAVAPCEAIVTRHDRDEANYRELGERYPQAVGVLPDGAGVLVAPSWVLTAGHVARGVASASPRVEAGGREHAVDLILYHPEWTEMAHDMAMLRLAEPIDDITPVALWTGDDETGRTVVFVGRGDWGTGQTGPQRNDRVKRGATNVVDRVDDDWIYFDFDPPETATELEGVSGPGDSGGPALLERDGVLYTLGVSVFADGDGGPGRYGVIEGYTRVSTHADWIAAVLRGEHLDAGVVPGAEPDGVRSLLPSGPSTLPETPAGRLVAGWLQAYNSDDDATMLAWIERRGSDGHRGERTEQELRDRYRLLFDRHFGPLTLERVLGADDRTVTVLCSSSRGPLAELRFQLTDEATPRLDGLRVGIVEIDHGP